ncbi:type II toxin-antitoxin system Phd/YefM family antitoxin [Polynucleobacter sp. IMCC30063]|uniref:type II toxin-antitoxin system Phd/YefM family antitoxin n=1 Tax=Polynucleobacter sp. IMCC30063 TaxID=2907298 RepID=UPI001F334795|nr:type II toxin-antitoxin system Phd/YefM family antitoxin [Polynucleobacter sp. IMCC30063]MCE7505917.1 type II toxin-antitoxin system Phd/YefM family antitoxin [Polynucleobacter sp. IMCC30063]
MKSNWAVQDAKARFSEFLNACLSDGPQVVTKRGLKAAVLITIQEWDALRESAHPALKDLLLSDQDRTELPLPKRGQLQRRKLTQI